MIPGLSKWRIDQAHNHATETGKGQPIMEKPIYRAGIEKAKLDHFLDYISRPELLQDVAFGTKTLKLDSGERVIIPAVVRTLIPSRIIQQYIFVTANRSSFNQPQRDPYTESLMSAARLCRNHYRVSTTLLQKEHRP